MNHRSAVLSKRGAMERVVVVILWTLLLLEVGAKAEADPISAAVIATHIVCVN